MTDTATCALPTAAPTRQDRKTALGAMRASRYVDGVGLQFPTMLFQHPSGKRVMLVGMMHLADETFYTGVQRRLDQLDASWEVHLEGVRPFVGPLTEDDANRVRTVTTLASFSAVIAGHLKLAGQGSSLKRRPGWKTYDVNALDVAAGFPAFSSESIERLEAKQAELTEDAELEKFRMRLRRPLPRLRFAMLSLLPPIRRIIDAIVHQRDQYAFDHAMQTDANVALVWGALHGRGIGKRLAAAGYRLTAIDWDTAIPASYWDHSTVGRLAPATAA